MGDFVNGILEWLLGFRPGALGGADGWEIDFVAEYGSYIRLLLVVVFAAMVYLTIRSYRREGDASVAAKAIPAALRLTAIVLVFLVLLRPAIVLRFVKDLQSTVVVLVDDSLSMNFNDHYAEDLSRPLAEFLEIEPEKLTEMSRLDVVRVALNRPDSVIDALAADHPLALMAFSTGIAAQQYTRPLATIEEPADRVSRDDVSAAHHTAEVLKTLEARGFETDISRSIRDVLDRMRGRRVSGVVLISDGQITTDGGDARLRAALDLANQRPVPLYAVMVGDPTPRKNLAVTSLDSPDEVRRQASVEMTATIAQRQLDGETVTVRLECLDKESGQWRNVLDADGGRVEQTIILGPADGQAGEEAGPAPSLTSAEGGAVRSVTLTFEPQDIGEFEYRVVADGRADEETQEDNASRPVTVRVTDEKINVLLVSGDAGWEFQYLRNFLYRDGDTYRVSVWQQNADEEINQMASTEGMKLTKLPRTLAELLDPPIAADEENDTGGADEPDESVERAYQVIILIDPQPTEGGFDGEFVDMLSEYVQRHGGGLCYVAGNKYTDTILLEAGPYKPLADILPVSLATNTTSAVARIREERPQPWQVRLTSYGVDHQVMRLGASAEETKAVWDMLPGIYWSHPVYQVKPGVRVLAEHSNPLQRTTGRNAPEPLIAVHTPGAGRVLYVGTNSTWRWRFLRDGYYHRRLWANVVNFLASGKAAKRITITAGGERFTAGKPIDVEVEAFDEAFAPIAADSFEIAMVNLETGQSHPIKLTAVDVEQSRGQFHGTIGEDITAHSGTFRLTVLGDSPDFEKNVAFKDIIIELPQDESRRKEADETTMRLIGSGSSAAGDEGNFLHLHDIDRLAELIPPGRLTTVHKQPRELWDSNLVLLLIVLLLSAEWIFRKKHNMA